MDDLVFCAAKAFSCHRRLVRRKQEGRFKVFFTRSSLVVNFYERREKKFSLLFPLSTSTFIFFSDALYFVCSISSILLNAWMDSFNLTTFSAYNPYNLIRFFWLDRKINQISNIRHNEHVDDMRRLIQFLPNFFSLFSDIRHPNIRCVITHERKKGQQEDSVKFHIRNIHVEWWKEETCRSGRALNNNWKKNCHRENKEKERDTHRIQTHFACGQNCLQWE